MRGIPWSLSQRVINSLRPSDAIWRPRTESTLAQVMACCLMAPSHYLNQCWLIIRVRSCGFHVRAISQELPQWSITKIYLKITCLKFHTNFPGANELMQKAFPCHDIIRMMDDIMVMLYKDSNDGTKPLPEPLSTYHYKHSSMAFTW